MKAHDRDRVGTLRMLLSELQKAAKEGSGDELAVLRRERKRRTEAERAFRDGGREELADAEAAEAELIAAYLPARARRRRASRDRRPRGRASRGPRRSRTSARVMRARDGGGRRPRRRPAGLRAVQAALADA